MVAMYSLKLLRSVCGSRIPMMKDFHAGTWELKTDHPHFRIPQKNRYFQAPSCTKTVEITSHHKENDPSPNFGSPFHWTKPVLWTSTLEVSKRHCMGIFLVQLPSASLVSFIAEISGELRRKKKMLQNCMAFSQILACHVEKKKRPT